MADDAEKTKQLSALLKGSVPKKRTPKASAAVTITGNGNVVGNGNVIHHNFLQVQQQKVVRPRIVAPPPDGAISEAQAHELKALVEEIGQLEIQTRTRPRGYGAIWKAFQGRMKVASYRHLLAVQFDEAKQYLMQERGRLLRSSAAKARLGGDFINSRMKAIHARCREFEDGNSKRLAYMQRNFNAKSMTDLDADQIERLYTYVFGWKRS